ncbi:beta-ketoacyl synthase chain length factor [Methylolobus aquaticus]
MRLQVAGIGISAPGLTDWQQASAVLRGEQRYVPAEYQPSGRSPLSGPERRRATAVTRLALEAAMEAAGPDRSRWDIPSVFTSSGGEVDVCDLIFTQLAEPERTVSPTQFHNSVHNAASGYWSIASGSHRPTTSLACYDDSFAAGLIEAAALLAESPGEVLLVAFDQPPPFPIAPFRPLSCPFAVALRLASGKGPVSLSIGFDDSDGCGPTVMSDRVLEQMRAGNPAARALPLLAAIARQEPSALLHLPCSGPGVLRVVVSCAQ